MAEIGKKLTLLDLTKRLDPNGSISAIAEILSETNEIFDDMPWIEANGVTGHVTTVRSGLPEATWRALNYGVPPSKSTTKQITDHIGMLEAYSEVDKDLAMLNGNTASFRISEDRSFLEAMNQEISKTIFYGDVINEKSFFGLAPRFNATNAESGQNIIKGGGTGSDNTSIYLVVWGPNTVHGIYPKGSKAGLSVKDLGEVTVEDAEGGKYQALRTHYQWKAGLTVRDWRYVVRIANIDVSDLTKNASSGADLIDLMVQALEIVPSLSIGTPVFYCNKTIKSFLRRQVINKNNVNLSLDSVAGKKILSFDGVPVKRCDQILNTESAIS